MDLPERLLTLITEKWGEVRTVLTVKPEDIRPWEELQLLSLSSPVPLEVDFIICEGTVSFQLTPSEAAFFMTCGDPDAFVSIFLKNALRQGATL